MKNLNEVLLSEVNSHKKIISKKEELINNGWTEVELDSRLKPLESFTAESPLIGQYLHCYGPEDQMEIMVFREFETDEVVETPFNDDVWEKIAFSESGLFLIYFDRYIYINGDEEIPLATVMVP